MQFFFKDFSGNNLHRYSEYVCAAVWFDLVCHVSVRSFRSWRNVTDVWLLKYNLLHNNRDLVGEHGLTTLVPDKICISVHIVIPHLPDL